MENRGQYLQLSAIISKVEVDADAAFYNIQKQRSPEKTTGKGHHNEHEDKYILQLQHESENDYIQRDSIQCLSLRGTCVCTIKAEDIRANTGHK